MDNLLIILELAFFFIAFFTLLQIGSSINFMQYFKKGKIREMQLLYFLVMLVLAYLVSSAVSHLIDLMYQLIN
jgi:uncharacterized membrane protein YwzB